MAIYEYTAIDQNQNTFSGIYTEIDGVRSLREELAKMGYRLLKARRKTSLAGKRARIRQAEVVTFTYRFAGMCSAGVSITQCLKTLEEQADNPAFKYVISDIRQSIERGSTLKDAFEKHRKIFSDFLLGMVEAGESGGRLAESLQMSANYLEKQAELRQQGEVRFCLSDCGGHCMSGGNYRAGDFRCSGIFERVPASCTCRCLGRHRSL